MEEKKIRIEITNRWSGKVLFEYEKVNNTIKETVEEAVKKGAYLVGANLGGAYLRGANLVGANLGGAYLRGADLGGANLRGAYLVGANLGGANLRGANLRGANLGGAYLRGADLGGANLRGAKDIPYIPMHCPSDGEFIGWKKVYDAELEEYFIVKLQILEDSKRSSATGTKCRCDKAKVLEIKSTMEPDKEITAIANTNYVMTWYKVGEIVEADSWDDNRWNECSHGIHFFINKQEAIDMMFKTERL